MLDVVTPHWLPKLRVQGVLADCHLDEFNAIEEWVPLYTPESLAKHLPAALGAYGLASKQPSLTAMVPAVTSGTVLGPDREFILMNFHRRDCIQRQSQTIDGRQRQLAFCPYCGIINENGDTALSHVRKHLDLMFLCGRCNAKSFLHSQALYKHMKDSCPTMTAIQGKTRGTKKTS